MAGKSDTFESQIMGLIFTGAAISQLALNASSSPLTALWFSLHTADPGDTGTQGTNETSYTGYTRIAVTRSTNGFIVSTGGGNVSPAASVTFPQATSTSTGTLTHFAIGFTSATTAGEILYAGSISPTINFGQNVTPSITTQSSFTED